MRYVLKIPAVRSANVMLSVKKKKNETKLKDFCVCIGVAETAVCHHKRKEIHIFERALSAPFHLTKVFSLRRACPGRTTSPMGFGRRGECVKLLSAEVEAGAFFSHQSRLNDMLKTRKPVEKTPEIALLWPGMKHLD